MKKLLFFLLLAGQALVLKAQQNISVKQGSVIGYNLKLHGQTVAMALQVTRLSDSVVLDWKIRNTATGRYVALPSAVNKANKLNFVQPEPNTTVTLSNQTFFFISKEAFKNLISHKSYQYDNTIYDLKGDGKPETITVDGKVISVLHVAARNETTEYWILNNPDFPLLCRIAGNPLGVDAEITSLK
ncbi:hypothetical protein [Mucilaginibacter sp. CSA2-8R]|uniref:hypothetical protein n=1 Tax=Mucilaginibacter sp. CSA2-8R TaxID=3141542 RepID=UPI00315D6571